MPSRPWMFCLATCLMGWGALASAADSKPHILLILVDDMGYGDLKAFNPDSKIPTPHLDRLAEAGLCFTDAHAGGSTCRPSRYSLLTGRFAARRDRSRDRGGPLIPAQRETVAGMLRRAGYRTAMVGKWHLGFDQRIGRSTNSAEAFDYSRPLTGGPLDRGFDVFFGMHASLDIPPYFYIRARNAEMAPTNLIPANQSNPAEEGWNRIQGVFWRAGAISPDFSHASVTPRFANEAVQVIQEHPPSHPLFLYLALPSPHTPWLPTEPFQGKSGAGMYGDFVMSVDHAIGQVLRSLDQQGMAKNTLVLFSSDNGPVWYDKDVQRFGHRSTGPLRGCKGSVWEGGHRVPFIARWPERVPKNSESDRLIAFADVFATLADLVDVTVPQGTAEDSESFLDTLLDPESPQGRSSPLLHGADVLRDGDWKLIDTKGGRGFNADRNRQYGTELYNLREDVEESQNLASRLPRKVTELRQKMRAVLRSPAPADNDSAWIELFNGQDLSGWEANTRPDSFTVAEGILKAHGKEGMSHLFFVGSEGRDVAFKNFELSLVARSEPGSNSGIFFHTGRELRKRKYLNQGYEVQLNSSAKEKRKTGSLYGIADLSESPVDETDWFEVRLRVEGQRIQVTVGGKQVVEYVEPANAERSAARAKRRLAPDGGALAIQAHDPNSVFYFRRIRIRELP